jgi:hypothetical protein
MQQQRDRQRRPRLTLPTGIVGEVEVETVSG